MSARNSASIPRRTIRRAATTRRWWRYLAGGGDWRSSSYGKWGGSISPGQNAKGRMERPPSGPRLPRRVAPASPCLAMPHQAKPCRPCTAMPNLDVPAMPRRAIPCLFPPKGVNPPNGAREIFLPARGPRPRPSVRGPGSNGTVNRHNDRRLAEDRSKKRGANHAKYLN
jgi:hypothetical protein